MLTQAAKKGFFDKYAGVRISRSGKRFSIEPATVWNLTDEKGRLRGQAAMLRNRTRL